MAFEEKKTRLNNMLGQRSSNSSTVGKSTAVPNDVNGASSDAENDGNEHQQDAAGKQDIGENPAQQVSAAKENAGPGDDSAVENPTGAPVLTAGMNAAGMNAAPASHRSPSAIQAIIEAAAASSAGPGGGGGATAAAAGAAPPAAAGRAQPAIGGHESQPTNAPASNAATKMEGGEGEKAPAPAAPAPTAPAPTAPAAPAAGAGNAGPITGMGASPKVNDAISKVAIGEKVTYSNAEEGNWFMDGSQIGSGTTIEWQAPYTVAMRNLRFEPYPSASKPAKGGTSKIIMVLAPTKTTFEKLGDIPAAGPGFAGVGMRLKVKVESSDVAFGNVEWLERPGPAEGVEGYFETYGAGSLGHVPAAGGIPMGPTNDGVIDSAFSRDKPKLLHKGTMRWWAGSFSWTVPTAYRLGGIDKVFQYVTQSFSMTDDGTMTVTKGGVSATHKPESKTDGKDVVKFKTVDEARVYLHPHGLHGIIHAALNYKRQPNADSASVKLLGEAVKDYDIRLKTSLTCRTTYDWTGADRVSLTANGVKSAPEGHSINNGDTKTYTFLMNSLVNLASLDTPSINLAASDKPMSTTLDYPYNGLSGAMGDRYTYSSYFAWK